MQITESITINAQKDKVWANLRTLEGAEKYIPMVTKSSVQGNGIGTKRVCDIQMGDQVFQITEKLEELNDEQNTMTISIQNAPPPMQGLQFTFQVKDGEEQNSLITISSEINENDESVKMIQDVLKMICQGLKNFHENH